MIYCFKRKKKTLPLLKAVLDINCAEAKPEPRERLGSHLFLATLHLNSASVSITKHCDKVCFDSHLSELAVARAG